ncbi:MAG: sugar porter family MFS transporter [Hyphomicrobiales bacterium]|nr:sugar porter family MFS transporter [Hyphomicrobiales bacterium]
MTTQPVSVHPPAAQSLSFVILIASAAALGGFLFGFDTAVINGAVVALRNEFAASSWQVGLSVSLALLGSAVGAFFAGRLADLWGRVRVMQLAAFLFLISAIGSGLPFGLADFIFWRFLGGMGVGAASIIAPAYIAEVSPADYRGRLGSLQQLAIVIGIFIALLSNYGLAVAAGSAEAPLWFGFEAWRWMFWSEAPAALVYGICAFMIPESPRYLVAQGRDAEAAAVLERVLAGDIRAKVDEIRHTIHRAHKPRLSDLRGRLGLLPIVWVGMGLAAFQQFVGINVIFYYGSSLWRVVGFTEESALIITVITGFTNIVTTLVAIACIDKFGRKPLLLFGSVGMLITLGIMAWVFGTATFDAQGAPRLTESMGMLALIAANAYVFCFGFSWGPVMWVLLGEMFNNTIRAAALAVAGAVQWIANFLVSTTFPPMADGLGLDVSYGIYATFAALSFLFVVIFVRETRGKELEEME